MVVGGDSSDAAGQRNIRTVFTSIISYWLRSLPSSRGVLPMHISAVRMSINQRQRDVGHVTWFSYRYRFVDRAVGVQARGSLLLGCGFYN